MKKAAHTVFDFWQFSHVDNADRRVCMVFRVPSHIPMNVWRTQTGSHRHGWLCASQAARVNTTNTVRMYAIQHIRSRCARVCASNTSAVCHLNIQYYSFFALLTTKLMRYFQAHHRCVAYGLLVYSTKRTNENSWMCQTNEYESSFECDTNKKSHKFINNRKLFTESIEFGRLQSWRLAPLTKRWIPFPSALASRIHPLPPSNSSFSSFHWTLSCDDRKKALLSMALCFGQDQSDELLPLSDFFLPMIFSCCMSFVCDSLHQTYQHWLDRGDDNLEENDRR